MADDPKVAFETLLERQSAGARDVSAVLAAIAAANRGGLGRTAILRAVEMAALGAETAGDAAWAEELRQVCDRIAGFCGPHARLDLTE